jgi:hypothetical protein
VFERYAAQHRNSLGQPSRLRLTDCNAAAKQLAQVGWASYSDATDVELSEIVETGFFLLGDV